MYEHLIGYESDGKIIYQQGGIIDPRNIEDISSRGVSVVVLPDYQGLADASKKYVSGEVLADRPTFTPIITPTSIPADGASLITIEDFPEGATLRISGPINDEWVETGTTTELTVNLPGTYRVTIDHWPHQTAEVTFHAT